MSYDDWKLATPPEYDDEPRKPRYYVAPAPKTPKTTDLQTNDLDNDDINF